MGEAMLFAGIAHAGRPGASSARSRCRARHDVPPGAVKVAVRPEAWQIGPPGIGLPARLRKAAYLGSFYEYAFDTELGPVFVVSADVGSGAGRSAQASACGLADHGVLGGRRLNSSRTPRPRSAIIAA